MALLIKQCDNGWRVDIFSLLTMQRLHCGSSFGLRIERNPCYCNLNIYFSTIIVLCSIFIFIGITIPLLNHQNQWLVQYYTDEKYQTIILNEKAQIIGEIDRCGYNVTLLNRDKIAFLDHNDI